MNEKKVSIILPVYNGADYISDSIKSIIAQTYSNWELIIVDDCSDDNTLKICTEFSAEDTRINVISNEQNLKLPNSLNIGFHNATGDYFTWTSDDNMYKQNAIKVLVDTLEYNNAVMVYSDYTTINSCGQILSEVKCQEPEYMVMGNVCGACFLYTAEIARKVGDYDQDVFLAEDYDYWIRIFRRGRIIYLTDSLYYYRQHSASLTETRKAAIDEQTYKVLEKNFLFLYAIAKKNHLVYKFFDHMLKRGDNHISETKEFLIAVDKRYNFYLKMVKLKEKIRHTIFFEFFCRLKGMKE